MGALDNQTTRSQNKALYRYLKAHSATGGVSSKDIWNELGIERSSARIHDLRHKYGLQIDTVYDKYVNEYGHTCRYGNYILREES